MNHLVIPDCQVREGSDFSYLEWIGNYIIDKKPDKIICLGDFADMPSLSSFDIGKKSFEGKRYKKDIEAAHVAMQTLIDPIHNYNIKQLKNKHKLYEPELHLTLGNHENRINKVIESDPKFDGTIGMDDLHYWNFGWIVHDFLQPIVLDGVCYSHYFISGVMGRPVTSAKLLLQKKHMSCVQGHNQNMEIHIEYKGDGKRITCLFAGTCNKQYEDYLGPQGNNYFRGIHMLYDVCDGEFYCHTIPLKYLENKYA
jgi:hypothetical protein